MGSCFSKNFNEIDFSNRNISNTKSFNLSGKILVGKVVDIHDGDTITCIFYIFEEYYKFKIRLGEIDTCEITSLDPKLKNKAIQAKIRLFNLITKNNDVKDVNDVKEFLNKGNYIIKVICGDFDKYGRLLGWIYDKNSDIDKDERKNKNNSFNHILINEKLAYLYYGNTKLSESDQIKLLL